MASRPPSTQISTRRISDDDVPAHPRDELMQRRGAAGKVAVGHGGIDDRFDPRVARVGIVLGQAARHGDGRLALRRIDGKGAGHGGAAFVEMTLAQFRLRDHHPERRVEGEHLGGEVAAGRAHVAVADVRAHQAHARVDVGGVHVGDAAQHGERFAVLAGGFERRGQLPELCRRRRPGQRAGELAAGDVGGKDVAAGGVVGGVELEQVAIGRARLVVPLFLGEPLGNGAQLANRRVGSPRSRDAFAAVYRAGKSSGSTVPRRTAISAAPRMLPIFRRRSPTA